MGIRAAVVGASGYAGGELLRLLDAHPTLELGALVAATNAGKRLGDVHPQLVSMADLPLLDLDAADLDAADVVFLAMPHGASAQIASTLGADSIVVDLGADFRLADPSAWQRWYPGEHAGTWPYGLPELPGARERLAGATRVANPGCYATAVALGLAPLLAADLVEADDLVVVAASGTTGAGRVPAVNLLASEVMADVTPYKVAGSHQHLGEMRQALSAVAGAEVSMSFTPLLVPMSRGILATCTATVRAGVDAGQLREAYAAYDDERFVTLLPPDRWPRTAAATGSNSAHLQVALDADAGRAVVAVAIDNLGKGAAGQAVQNANLLLGLDETAGLSSNGVGQ
jgi:N-acetyl-gamma-glutamyl-phosphate reductase